MSPTHWEDARLLPPSGRLQNDGAAAKEEAGKDIGLTPTGGCNGGGVHTGGRDICHPPPEHSCTIYCDKSHCGPVCGGGAETRGKVSEAVVGAGCP